MNNTQLSTKEYDINKANTRNKTFLGFFLLIVISTILSKFIVGVILDMGYFNGKLHIGFKVDPKEAFGVEYNDFLKLNNLQDSNTSWFQFLKMEPGIKTMISNSPNFLWPLTQFTWLTTIIVMLFLIFRFFKFEEKVPKWLKWIMTQKTLSLITIYEIIVGSFFWIAFISSSDSNYNGSLSTASFVISIFVHAIIPMLLSLYSLIYLIKDKHASLLRETIPVKGLIYPAIYAFYYVLLTIIWNDPYAISELNSKLTLSPTKELLSSPDWTRWAISLWKLPTIIVIIYIVIGVMSLAHNVILVNLNKNYESGKDYEAGVRYEKSFYHLKRKIFKKTYGRGWRIQWKKINKKN